MRKTESQLQQECYIYFNNTYSLKNSKQRLLMFSVPNETAMEIRGVLKRFNVPKKIIDSAVSIVMRSLKLTGFTAGISDTIILLPSGKSIFVEFKTEIGSQSPSQIEFQNRLENLGHKYYICRSLEEFKTIIEENV